MTAALLPLLLAATVTGVVYDDRDGSGRRDPGEAGLPGVVVSDGTALAGTGPDGSYRLESPRAGRLVFVVTPGDRDPGGAWYRPWAVTVDFGLAPRALPAQWRFAHLSDTHVAAGNRERVRRAFALARERGASLALVSGDLVRDALRVGEPVARAGYEMFREEAARPGLPVRTALGNHEVFGIERHLSHVPVSHPAYGKRMYEEYLGPRYYAFNCGGVHFIVLDTVGVDDRWYYGWLDPEQLDWIRRELALVPADTPVVTIGHIPLRSGAASLAFLTEGPARTLLGVRGVTSFRHVVRNASGLDRILAPRRWVLALQGHTHRAERLRLWGEGGAERYDTAPAVDRPAGESAPSGIVIYGVREGTIGDGELVSLDEPDGPEGRSDAQVHP